MPSIETPHLYDDDQRRMLLDVAARSIQHGLARSKALIVDPRDFPSALQATRATFVTLETGGDLRGCIGVLEAYRPLVEDVAENAFSAAFRDPRFPPLRQDEWAGLHISVSVLSAPEAMDISSEADALAQIRPRVDGLILEDRGHRGTFLPSVWDQLPDAADFLSHLKRKAGLPMTYWSDSVKLYRYRTESFGCAAAAA